MRVFNPKVEAILKKFPFLAEISAEFNILDAKVELVDDELLNRTAGSFKYFDRPREYHTIFIFVTSSAGSVFPFGEVGHDHRWRRYWLKPWTWVNPVRHETVMDCIQRCKPRLRSTRYLAFDISHVVVLVTYSSEKKSWHKLTVHKFPGKLTFSTWLEERIKALEMNVKEEIDALDKSKNAEVIK